MVPSRYRPAILRLLKSGFPVFPVCSVPPGTCGYCLFTVTLQREGGR